MLIQNFTITLKEITEWVPAKKIDSLVFQATNFIKGRTNITCLTCRLYTWRTYSPILRSSGRARERKSSLKNEKKASAKIKAMKWHCSHQERDEEKGSDWGRARWVWVQTTSHFKVKSESFSLDIRLVRAFESRVEIFIHLTKHHHRQLGVPWDPAFEGTENQDEGRTCGDLWAFERDSSHNGTGDTEDASDSAHSDGHGHSS